LLRGRDDNPAARCSSGYFVDGAVVQLTGARPPKVGDVGAVGLNRRTADRLRRLVTPTSACALALTVVGRLSALELRSLTLQHVHGDGAEVVVGDRHIDLPVHAAGLVRVQLLARRDQAAADNQALLVTARGTPFDRIVLERQIDKAAQLASIWPPQSQQCPAWHTPPVSGHDVEVFPVTRNWKAVSG
jgi:integrase